MKASDFKPGYAVVFHLPSGSGLVPGPITDYGLVVDVDSISVHVRFFNDLGILGSIIYKCYADRLKII